MYLFWFTSWARGLRVGLSGLKFNPPPYTRVWRVKRGCVMGWEIFGDWGLASCFTLTQPLPIPGFRFYVTRHIVIQGSTGCPYMHAPSPNVDDQLSVHPHFNFRAKQIMKCISNVGLVLFVSIPWGVL